MRKFGLVGIAIFAVLAFSAFSASAAFAEPELLFDEATVTANQGLESEGELELTDTKAFGGAAATVKCSGFLDGTYLFAERKIDIETILTLGKKSVTSLGTGGSTGEEASVLCEALTICEKTTDVELNPVNLPWLLTIVLDTVGTEDLYLLQFLSAGNGPPGWEITCLDLGVKLTDECTGETLTADLQNMSPLDLLGVFGSRAEEEANKETGTCTLGGAGTGVVEGEGLITATSGLTVEVSG